MDLKVLPHSIMQKKSHSFKAQHPMFKYEVPAVSEDIKEKLLKASNVVVIGMGGSVIPLKAFADAADLNEQIHFVDTVDPRCWRRVLALTNPVFCLVSKSGETLEVKALMAELVAAKKISDCIIVTDKKNGFLRDYSNKHGVPSLEIPSDIGGRFTNFTVFHRAVLERFGADFNSLLDRAKKLRDELKTNSDILETLFENLFVGHQKNLILWAYGERLHGLAVWVQQALAESLGKRSKEGKRMGNLPIVLKGPQDQHSVLQLLIDGPQERALWFLTPKGLGKRTKRELTDYPDIFNKVGLNETLNILAESTYKTFEERLENKETSQPLARWNFEDGLYDVVEMLVIVQALVEYAGEKLHLNAFDQPGVERGKQIARELVSSYAS